MNRLGIRGGEPIRAIDRGMRGNAQKEKLAAAGKQDLQRRTCLVRRRRKRDETADEIVELAEAAHGFGRDGARKAAVADRECLRRFIEGFIERTLTPQAFAQCAIRRGPRARSWRAIDRRRR